MLAELGRGLGALRASAPCPPPPGPKRGESHGPSPMGLLSPGTYPAFVPRDFVAFPLPGLLCLLPKAWPLQVAGSWVPLAAAWLLCVAEGGRRVLEGQRGGGQGGESEPALWTEAGGGNRAAPGPEQGCVGGAGVGQGSYGPAQPLDKVGLRNRLKWPELVTERRGRVVSPGSHTGGVRRRFVPGRTAEPAGPWGGGWSSLGKRGGLGGPWARPGGSG